jgi:hypothetical protein
MLGESPSSSSGPLGPSQPAAAPPRWLLPLVLALVLGGFGAYAWSRGWFASTPITPIDGELLLAVRPDGRARDSLRVDEAGALPVRDKSSMNAEVHLNQPACAYLVWYDTEGRILPLYPWNNETLDVKDVNQPPPVRRGSKLFMSPMTIGGGWPIGPKGGMDTVLLLVRRTPMDATMKLGELLTPLPHVKMREPNEVVMLGLNPGGNSVATILAKNRGAEAEARANDEPLRSLMLRLHDHFEFVRAVRFAHAGE